MSKIAEVFPEFVGGFLQLWTSWVFNILVNPLSNIKFKYCAIKGGSNFLLHFEPENVERLKMQTRKCVLQKWKKISKFVWFVGTVCCQWKLGKPSKGLTSINYVYFNSFAKFAWRKNFNSQKLNLILFFPIFFLGESEKSFWLLNAS